MANTLKAYKKIQELRERWLSVKTHKNNPLSSKEHVYTPFLNITKTGLEVEGMPSKSKYEIPWNKIVEMSFKFTKD